MAVRTASRARSVTAARPSPSPGLRRAGLAAAALVLTAFFFVMSFPWDRLGDATAARVGQLLGADVAVAHLSTSWLPLPGFRASGVRMHWPDGRSLELEQASVRPAFSTAWLRGRPALFVSLAAPLGTARGTLLPAGPPAFAGRLGVPALARLPLTMLVPELSLDGRADADVDLRLLPDGPRGEARFEAHDGSLALPGLPVALPYTTLRGELGFTDAASVEVRSLSLEGPMLAADAKGSVGRAPIPQLAPLDLELHVQVRDASLRPALAGAGLRFGPDGAATLHLRGTPQRPLLQ